MRFLNTLLFIVGSLAFAGVAQAAPPRAGTAVVNQATITYKDEYGVDRETTTNEVVLVVKQVYAATLDGDRSALVGAGQTHNFNHTLTNNGNGLDDYCISVADLTTDSNDYLRIDVVRDANANGLYDTGEQVLYTTASPGTPAEVTLDYGDVMHLIVSGIVPAGANTGDTLGADLLVQAKEGNATCQTGTVTDIGANGDALDDTNQDLATVTDAGVLVVQKTSIYVENGPGFSDDQIIYEIRAEALVDDVDDALLTDTLPAGVTFNSFGTHDGPPPNAPVYAAGVVTMDLDPMAAGDVVIIRFTVDLDDTLPGGTVLVNQATGTYSSGSTFGVPVESNETEDTTPVTYGVTIEDTGAAGLGDDDNTLNDITHQNAATTSNVLFRFDVTNTGNADDTFNLMVTGDTFPAGTVFKWVHVDGATPVLDSNSDATPDTGPIAPGATATYYLVAQLPPSAFGGPYTADVQAQSSGDTSVDDPSQASLGSVSTPLVDIVNDNSVAGFNDGGTVNATAIPVVGMSQNVVPGQLVTFPYSVANEGVMPDTYQLSVWQDAATTNPMGPNFAAQFYDMTGNVITATPLLAPGQTFDFEIRFAAPSNAPAGTVKDAYIRTLSASTGANDVVRDEIIVAANEQILFTPNSSGPIVACDTKDYDHTLQNLGSEAEDIVIATVSQTTMTSILYVPTNFAGGEPNTYMQLSNMSVGDNVAVQDAAGNWGLDALVTDGSTGVAIPLDPNEQTRIRASVYASCSAVQGQIDVLSLSATVVNGSASDTVQDITTVSDGQVSLHKDGALDGDCNGAPESPYATSGIEVAPGECVVWRLTLTNTGTETVCNVQIHDEAPGYTSMNAAPTIQTEPAPGTGVCVVAGDAFSCSVGNDIDITGDAVVENYCLRGGESAEINFRVSVD